MPDSTNTRDRLDLTPHIAALEAMRDATGDAPREPDLPAVTRSIGEVVALLVAADTARAAEAAPADNWTGMLIDDEIMVIGPGLFLLAARDRSTTSVISGTTGWSLAPACRPDEPTSMVTDCTHVTVSVDGVAAGEWTLDPQGRVISRVDPRMWRPTHVVAAGPLEVGGVPAGSYAPGTVLEPGLEVSLIDTTIEGWALVECSNGWQCYVAAWGLAVIGGSEGSEGVG